LTFSKSSSKKRIVSSAYCKDRRQRVTLA
jgi:hypothetical protein